MRGKQTVEAMIYKHLDESKSIIRIQKEKTEKEICGFSSDLTIKLTSSASEFSVTEIM